ncbi:phosphatase PAP2 family protein [Gemmobacter lutimaris]|uniref:Phosphatase PAP2 family protein n=1 Tax=Gemmobacter lutimaris TaxID=2306023 RepID=A0A398BS70_9RHOB|nr:phosphatase PAP2 family protein [Gemmobacter lutimaris]RID92584.1 phosphatase PAP2 family protein [Gemmobacter lutimaris]
MVRPYWKLFGRVQLVLAALSLSLILCEPAARRYGDRLQIALPLIAGACALADGRAGELMLRFVGVFTVAHGTKRLLGDSTLNTRPSGGTHGFPSAHTAAAAFGASSLLHDCLPSHPVARAVVVIAAGFVGASRIQAQAHDIWQVLAGAVLGWLGDRLLRRDSVARRGVTAGLRRIGRGLRTAPAWLRAAGTHTTVSLRLLVFALMTIIGTSATRAETELALYGGWQGVAVSDITAPSGRKTVNWRGKSLEAPPYYGLRLTRWLASGWGYGLDLNHAKAYADNPARHGYERLEFSDGLNIATLTLWYRWPENRHGIFPYAGVGAGVAVPHVDIRPNGGAHTFGCQMTGPAIQAVAGLRGDLSARWSAFVEIKATWSHHDIALDSGGKLGTDLTTGALNVGLARRF